MTTPTQPSYLDLSRVDMKARLGSSFSLDMSVLLGLLSLVGALAFVRTD